ncbi:putative photosynthetic complex assembly protein 2 [Sulfitobacter noctilucicola]|uniref:Putative photosynthetic complex assembly protein 2 n=1 Tax=Sulfitobacter noctilucicola TaxID=1342301 RepID=A0A7W6MD78_9RHOB|nr:putative photosynthetic complex assembly protein PuhE [Sulfitobacter noctilucicola]KIN69965.1 putative photosynthetic complex assembly protein 2 [Sulfitobacter noctilucicola]MBB4176072.1 putative photosynthetic complex assembly protein 2 [Sulfitobacter noctilucicola]
MTFTSPFIAAVTAVFAWWFFTGAILLVVRRADGGDAVAHGRNVFLSIPLLALGAAGLVISSVEQSVLNVYVAFISTLLIWGWIELAFLAGVITGPERRPCPAGLTGRARFARAWQTVSYHELLLLAGFLLILTATRGAENHVGFWTYTILFTARISAKLNLFFGVPRINTEFVPQPLQHLKSYFRQGPVTMAFPIGVTFLSISAVCFTERLIASGATAAGTGFALLTALAALATLEHWLMVVPLPDAKLWRWMLPETTTTLAKDKTHEL